MAPGLGKCVAFDSHYKLVTVPDLFRAAGYRWITTARTPRVREEATVRGAARRVGLSAQRRLLLVALSTLSVLAAGLVLGGGPALAAAHIDPHFSPLAQREASASFGQIANATFNPDTLISDANFRAVSSMSQAEVQTFLEGRSGILKSYAAPDINGTVKPASQIIWEAAQAFDVSPKVVLVTLQKEQGLLSSPAPSASALAWAMGCGSPSSFGAQVWWGSDSLSVDGAGWYAGITKSCGDGTVSPTNISTYSLYTYTPWIGLAGGGNKLFWTLYWQYFGDPIGDDVNAPTTTATGFDSAWHSKAVTVSFAATDNPGGSGVAYTEYSRDGGVIWIKGTSLTIAAPADHSNDGPQRILFRSADKAGNLASTHRGAVKIDTRKPRPLANRAASVLRGRTATLRYYVSDPRPGSPSATAVIKIRTLAGRSVKTIVVRGPVNRSLSAHFVCWFARGSYRFTVSATDAAGNTQAALASNRLAVH